MTGTWTDSAVSRRGALTLGAAAAAAGLAGCTGASDAGPARRAAARVTMAPLRGRARLRARDWDQLARSVDGTLARPGDGAYGRVRLVENPAYDAARPLAVLSVASAADVATGLAFARDHDLPVALRSGGHSYPGWSAGDDRLVLDVRPLSRIRLRPGVARAGSAAGATADRGGETVSATVGAGASLSQVYERLARDGRGLAAGSCATVGIAGLTLGGGVGIVSRAYGLTCDAVTSMQVVTAAGDVLRVSAEEEPDLYWALRGGGGGHLGVVTSLTFDTFAAPRVSTAFWQWPLAAAAEVLPAWQAWAPGADPRLWSTLRALGGTVHTNGPVLALSATWTGPDAGLDRWLDRLDVPPPSVSRRLRRSYLAVSRAYAGCTDVPARACRTGPGGSLERRRFAATSHVAYDPLTDVGVATLVDRVATAHGSAGADGLAETGISLDPLGGAIGEPAPGDTAFVHRRAIATVQYTATHAVGSRPAALAFVRGSRAALTPDWGRHAYVNYADAAIEDHRDAYFGANGERLSAVRERYDPDDFFSQPQGY